MTTAAKKRQKKSYPPLETLLEELKHPEYKVRRNAARDLGKLKDPRAVEPLILALKDKTINVRSRTVTALGRLGRPEAVLPLLFALKDKACHVHKPAYNALIEIGAAGIEPLCQALKHEKSEIRYSAATILANVGDERAYEPLLELLRDEVSWVRTRGVVALGFLKAKVPVAPLIEIATSSTEEKDIRLAALQSLGEIGDSAAIPPLIQLIEDDDPTIKEAATFALGNFPQNPSVVRVLLHSLETETSGRVLAAVILSLGRTEVKSVIPELRKALRNSKRYDQLTVICALFELSGFEITVTSNWLKGAGINPELYQSFFSSTKGTNDFQSEMAARGKRTRFLMGYLGH